MFRKKIENFRKHTCEVTLSSKVIMTMVLGWEKRMQLMIWIRYNRIKQFFAVIYASVNIEH